MLKNPLREKLAAGQVVCGSFMMIPAAGVPELLAYSGFDFGLIDQEHGLMNDDRIEALTRAGDAHGLPLIVRPPALDRAYIMHALDRGAVGVQVPQIYTAEEAARAVSYVKYPPMGLRGVAQTRCTGYGHYFAEYARDANDLTLTIVHCETKELVECIDEVVKVPGLDVVFVGPFDLSFSLGFPGQVDHPAEQKAIEKVAEACRKAGVAAGIYVRNAQDAKKRIAQGFTYLTYSEDWAVLMQGYKKFMEELKG